MRVWGRGLLICSPELTSADRAGHIRRTATSVRAGVGSVWKEFVATTTIAEVAARVGDRAEMFFFVQKLSAAVSCTQLQAAERHSSFYFEHRSVSFQYADWYKSGGDTYQQHFAEIRWRPGDRCLWNYQ